MVGDALDETGKNFLRLLLGQVSWSVRQNYQLHACHSAQAGGAVLSDRLGHNTASVVVMKLRRRCGREGRQHDGVVIDRSGQRIRSAAVPPARIAPVKPPLPA